MADYNDRLSDYVDVAERIKLFREKHPEGSLQPVNLEKPFDIVTIADKTFIVYISAAYRTPDDPRPAVGLATSPPLTLRATAVTARTVRPPLCPRFA